MRTLVECVPNFSEGRDAAKVDAIVAAMLEVPGVSLLDREMDADHNRCVITLVGPKEAIGEAALRGVGKAAELIDLTKHRGAHPRLGAADVVPFIPIEGVTIDDCVALARQVGQQIWERFCIPVYLYEAAATRAERDDLAEIVLGVVAGVDDLEPGPWQPVQALDFRPLFEHPAHLGAQQSGSWTNVERADAAEAPEVGQSERQKQRVAQNVQQAPALG